MIRKLAFIASLGTLFPTALYAADEFSLYDVKLGMTFDEMNRSILPHCRGNCMGGGSNGPAGMFETTMYLRYHTEYFSNTRRSEVNRHKPYESVTYTFGPDRKVIGMRMESYGYAKDAVQMFDRMAGLYQGELLSFTEQKDALVTAKTDVTTTHTVGLYEPNLRGKKFQVAMWVTSLGPTMVRMDYGDFDAVRKLEAASPAAFVMFRGKAVAGVTPRRPSSYEAANALKFKPVTSEATTKVIDGADTIEVSPEILDGEEHPPSQLVVNGKVVGTSGLLADGISFREVQKLGQGLYRVNADWAGNGCSSQQELVLRVAKGKGTLSEPFGRCNATLTENDGTIYYSFDESADEPQLTVAIP